MSAANPGLPGRTGIETSPVSWLGGSLRSDRNGGAVFPSGSESLATRRPRQWLAPNSSPPYSRAAATAFHRLPVHEVSGECGRHLCPWQERRLRSQQSAPRNEQQNPPANGFRAKSRAAGRWAASRLPAAPRKSPRAFPGRTRRPEDPHAGICLCGEARCDHKTRRPNSARA